MALIVEDGTGVIGAESYISVAAADTYHEKRGNTAWDSVDDKEAALIRATEYMTSTYRTRWLGQRASDTQGLDWPRYNVRIIDSPTVQAVYANNVVPTEVKYSCAALALRAASDVLEADETQKIVSVQVGPISTTYDSSSSPAKKYKEIDSMLKPFLKGGGQIPMVRV